MSDSESDVHPPPTDEIVQPGKNTKQFKVQVTTDGILFEDTTILKSDFNIILRYDIYDEEKIDEIESHLVVQLTKEKSQKSLLDLYFYDKSKTKEYRYWILFSSLESIQNEIDHDKGFSTLKLVFDQGKEYNLKNCPVEIVQWLSNFLLSL
jgi:hypothetical protein